MKKQSKIITTAVTLVLFAFLTSNLLQAQPRQERRGPMPPDSTQIVKMVDELAKAVSLSEKQKEEVLKLHFEHFSHAKAEMGKGQRNHEAMRKAHDEMRAKFEKQIKAVLNEKQQAKFEKYLKQQRKERRRSR
ncbi:hypothetical protein H8E88_35890 [candidate division KSB1 bacterium]|nr:hypothetical protein [candidate division KSB1 bacterium]